MWEIKYYHKKGKTKVLKSEFSSKEEAEIILIQDYKNKEEIYVVETKESTNLSENIGKWLWLYSPKKQEMFSYGILLKTDDMFTKIKTRKDAVTPIELSNIRNNTIQKWLEIGQAELRSEGHFVTIKEYV